MVKHARLVSTDPDLLRTVCSPGMFDDLEEEAPRPRSGPERRRNGPRRSRETPRTDPSPPERHLAGADWLDPRFAPRPQQKRRRNRNR